MINISNLNEYTSEEIISSIKYSKIMIEWLK